MLKLRQDQVDLLTSLPQQHAVEAFETRILRQHPSLRDMPRTQLRAFTTLALAKGKRYGLRKLGDIERLSRTMLALGSHFDEDPMLPDFRRHLLRDDTGRSRTQTLQGEVAKYLLVVRGDHHVHLFRALGRMRSTTPRRGDSLYDTLHSIYPEKFIAMDWPQAHARGMEWCHHLGYETRNQQIVYFAHALVLGAGFVTDPLYTTFQRHLGCATTLRGYSLALLEQPGIVRAVGDDAVAVGGGAASPDVASPAAGQR